MADITVCCTKWGDKFGPEYVNNLYSGVRRNIHRHSFEFVCFTERPEGVRSEVRTEPLLCDYPGFWAKIGMFRPGIPAIKTDRFLHFDLACVIVGDLDEVIDLDTDWAVCRDWPPEMKPENNAYAGGAYLMRVGGQPQVFERFTAAAMKTPDGEQGWVCLNAPGAMILPYDWSPSYKLRRLQAACPPDAKWVMFHGVPKPHQCGGWVKEKWSDL
jgi:hypothetical protein